jgi:hypothetical protein
VDTAFPPTDFGKMYLLLMPWETRKYGQSCSKTWVKVAYPLCLPVGIELMDMVLQGFRLPSIDRFLKQFIVTFLAWFPCYYRVTLKTATNLF